MGTGTVNYCTVMDIFENGVYPHVMAVRMGKSGKMETNLLNQGYPIFNTHSVSCGRQRHDS